jgi:adenosine deaminase
MRTISPSKTKLIRYFKPLAFLLLCAMVSQAQTTSSRSTEGTPEQRTARFFESIRKSPPQQLAFLLKMPKGADLHNHLSGSIYAERYVEWAAEKKLCVNQMTMLLSEAPCATGAGQVPASQALTDSVLYRQMINAWSMRFWQFSGQNGHDQFFDSFGKFGAATWNQTGAMLADAARRAARGRVSYLELMLTPDGGASGKIGDALGWDGNFESTLSKLQSGKTAEAMANAQAAGIKTLRDGEAEKDRLMNCGTQQAEPGCNVTIRYIVQVTRGSSPGSVFAQMVTGFTLANDPNTKVVALNLVQAEDGLTAMKDFQLHMRMLEFLRPRYPNAHLTLHAGELAPGLVPPEGLTFHIRQSVLTAGAQRIGHGVDIMNEDEPYELLMEMARRNILVEVCLTSNDVILGISREHHPLATYMQYGVPVALATDDEGVSRSEISREFLKAAQEQGLGYAQLKMMARNSLHYAFLSGDSLWTNAGKFVPVQPCAKDLQGMKVVSNGCKQYLDGSEKARLQWKLEEDFKAFESRY